MKLSAIYIIDNYNENLEKILESSNNHGIIFVNRLLDKEELQNINKGSNEIIDCYGKNLFSAIKEGLKKVQSEYVYIASSSILFNKNLLKKLDKIIDGSYNVYSFNARGKNRVNHETSEILESDDFCALSIYQYVFKTELIKNLKNIEDINDLDVHAQILMNILDREKVYFVDKKLIGYAGDTFNFSYYDEKFYTYSIENIYIPFFKEERNLLVQRIIYFLIFRKFSYNKNGANKEVLIGDDRYLFFESVGKLMKLLDRDMIASLSAFNGVTSIVYSFKYMMFYLMGKIKKYEVDFDDEGIYSLIDGTKVYVNSDTIKIAAINYNKGKILVDAFYEYYSIYEANKDAFYAKINGKKVKLKEIGVYTLQKMFGVSSSKKYSFQIEIPFDGEVKELSFGFKIGDREKELPITFTKPGSRLTNTYKASYWNYKDLTLTHNIKNNSLVFKKRKALNSLKLEIKYAFNLIVRSSKKQILKILFLRILYWLLKPFYKNKKIWLYFDKLYKAGDNGEYQAEYASSLNDGIKHYYVLNSDSLDFERIKNSNIPIIKFNSIKHKLYTLYAENIVATHPDIIKFCGFGQRLGEAFRGLYNANIICIAHGLTIQKNAEVQNRLYDNTMFYTTSSKYEVEHITKPIYGYSQDEVALTGLARFDKMIACNKKQILITPTWRRSVSGTSNFNQEKGYNAAFKNTTYFKLYNTLINDKKLISCAKKHGYKIMFLLHPAMSAQIDDYDKNEYVDIEAATSDIDYKVVLGESDLMVTDYSGVQYDFAFMHKPIVYYHPSSLPPRFEEGALKYDTMGFGPICTEHDEIVNTLCEYIENDCKIKAEYAKRIDNFIEFSDLNNRKRIHEAILKFTKDHSK